MNVQIVIVAALNNDLCVTIYLSDRRDRGDVDTNYSSGLSDKFDKWVFHCVFLGWLVMFILYSALVAVALLLFSSSFIIDILTVNFMTITVPLS